MEILGSTLDLNSFLIDIEIIAAALENVVHYSIFVKSRVFEHYYALSAEHERYTADSSEISAELIKIMAHLACCSVSVVSKTLNDYSYAVGAVSLISDVLVVIFILAAGSFLDNALDVVVRHVVCLCLCDKVAKLAVVVRVRAALADNYCYLTSDLCEDFALNSVRCFLFTLDIIPF